MVPTEGREGYTKLEIVGGIEIWASDKVNKFIPVPIEEALIISAEEMVNAERGIGVYSERRDSLYWKL